MAYAAVTSPKHSIERLINPINPEIARSAYQELELLRDALKRLDGSSNSGIKRSKISALDAEIREAVYKVDDGVESYALYQKNFAVDEEGLKDEMYSFLKTVKKLKEEYIEELNNPFLGGKDDEADSPMEFDFGGKKSTMIGLVDEFEKIRNDLLDLEPGLKVVSLFGMAGIGKTVLAGEIFLHPVVIQEFDDIRVWVTIGPEHQIETVLASIVSQINGNTRHLYMGEDKDKDSLADRIFKSLYGRKYFIVLDDAWNAEVRDSLMRFFPPGKKGSRILLTTRQEETAVYSTTTSVHKIRFLNKEESWNLLCDRVFGDKPFPPELEKVGRKIAENCEGLPLLILTVADLLSRLEMTEECWKRVADKKNTTFTDAYDIISEVLYSSYEYLSQYLRVCFLYMGAFTNSQIPRSKLIDLWTVEDFLEPNGSQTVQHFGDECLKKLVSQSLVIACKESSYDDRITSSKLHSAYWHLCVKEARKNRFLHVLKIYTDASEEYIERQRRLAVQNNILFGIKQVYEIMANTLTARSLLCTGEDHQYPVPLCFNLVLLKVLDALAVRFYEFPEEVLKLLRLRYLALTHYGNLPPLVSVLRSLQCFIVRKHHNIKILRLPTCLPKEIWDMRELRHLRIMGSNLPDPSSTNGAQLPNLLTLNVNAESCTEGVFRGIPNLKKLQINIEMQPDASEIPMSCFKHISILQELESLKCVVVNCHLRSQAVAPLHCFSRLGTGLKKLSLNGLVCSSKCMRAFGSLRFLQVLKLRCCAFEDPLWRTRVDEFPSLKYLLLEDVDLQQWEIEDEKCLQRLQFLTIRHCFKLKKIPWQIGPILTLKRIEIVDCSPAVVASALEIQEDERHYGNYSLQLEITSSWSL